VDNGLHPDLELVLGFYKKQRDAPPPVFAHAARLLAAPQFFSSSALQQYLNNPLLTPSWLTLLSNGKVVPLESAALLKVVQNRELVFMDKELIEQPLVSGGALLLEGLDILDPAINAFVATVDSTLPCALSNCVAFLSQRGSEAYQAHCDTDDVLVVQIEGAKRWRIFAPQQRRYVGNILDDSQLGPQVAELTLEAGDALYIRAGVPHRCETKSDYSLHLSFDLCDRTPNIEQITHHANSRYNQACELQYSPASKVTQRYIALLSSPQFQSDLASATQQVRKDAMSFRQRIGRASAVRALDKLRRQSTVPQRRD
jgi:ribosomal protein L16 Arg81 hydroxylase